MPEQSDVVICEPLRTPVGRFGGALAGRRPAALAARVISEIVARTGIDPERIDEVILGHAYPTSEAPAIGRVAALDAGLPDTVTGTQVDRRCRGRRGPRGQRHAEKVRALGRRAGAHGRGDRLGRAGAEVGGGVGDGGEPQPGEGGAARDTSADAG
ncbi:hypothetical protein GCM10017673_29420 [Streptosporangium violaceochromogenes]|nr:hypothetical protein GCM10017673_29420 [Streptosporangium violaceochromogenes]